MKVWTAKEPPKNGRSILSGLYFRAVCISVYSRISNDIFISFWISALYHYSLHWIWHAFLLKASTFICIPFMFWHDWGYCFLLLLCLIIRLTWLTEIFISKAEEATLPLVRHLHCCFLNWLIGNRITLRLQRCLLYLIKFVYKWKYYIQAALKCIISRDLQILFTHREAFCTY